MKIENAKALLDGNTKCYRPARWQFAALTGALLLLWTSAQYLITGVWDLRFDAAALAFAYYMTVRVGLIEDELRSAKSIIAEFLPGGRQGPGVG